MTTKDDVLFAITKENVWKIATIALAVLLVLSWTTDVFRSDEGAVPTPSAAPAAGGPSAPAPGARVEVSADDDPVLGDADAPVTIIEFSDYECPFCGRFFAQTLPQIKKEYIDKGLVKIVYRDFPLSFHPNAQKAAEAAECAGDQGRYFEMHDKIFENQQAIGVADLKAYAASLGLDADTFNDCLDSGKFAQEIRDDVADGQAAGVSGTPSFFINGRELVGAQPFGAFKAIIDAELEK